MQSLLGPVSERLRSKHVRTLELLQKTVDENVELRDKITSLQQRPSVWNEQLSSDKMTAFEDEVERLKADQYMKMAELEDSSKRKYADLQSENRRLEQQNQSLTNENVNLKIQAANDREAFGAQKSTWEHEKKKLGAEIVFLQSNFDSQVVRNQEQEATIERLSLELRSKTKDVLDSKAQLTTLEQSQADLSTQVVDLTTQLKESQDQITRLETELAVHNGQRTQLQQELLETRNKLLQPAPQTRVHRPTLFSSTSDSDLESKLHAAMNKTKTLDKQKAEVSTTCARLEKEVQYLRRRVQELVQITENGHRFNVHVQMKRENHALKQQIDELKQLQKKYLTTPKKSNMTFPALRGT